MRQDILDLLALVRLCIAPDDHMGEVLEPHAADLHDGADGQFRKGWRVLDSRSEPLLCDGGDKLPVHHEAGGGVGVLGVEAENGGHGEGVQSVESRPRRETGPSSI
ncbi:MAG TPA: hypothetical protein PKE47_05035, partial [Verrucomicrobiota bacterium]|nr:hypothetical protein [Verrucomicrobiota bacterium]